MRRLLIIGLAIAVNGALVLAIAGLFALRAYEAPGPLTQATHHVVERGSGLAAIAQGLEQAGIVEDARYFSVAARLSGKARALKAGEYAFAPAMSLREVLELLESGRTVVRRLTVPEGRTTAEILTILEEAEGLIGALPADRPAEGTLLPETYHYSWGDRRDQLLARMRSSMEEALAGLWEGRAEDLPIETPEQAVILASIVEKETGVAEERPLVASVFINRLRRGMRLQSDPTVVYALTEGDGPLGRTLTRADWEIDHPYNTYRIEGLPPGPIANPGRDSIAAVLDPADSDYLYFVADGTGGHAFARTLDEHNRNVARWRQIRDGQEQ